MDLAARIREYDTGRGPVAPGYYVALIPSPQGFEIVHLRAEARPGVQEECHENGDDKTNDLVWTWEDLQEEEVLWTSGWPCAPAEAVLS